MVANNLCITEPPEMDDLPPRAAEPRFLYGILNLCLKSDLMV